MKSNDKRIIILAGGKGTRMNQDFPKVLTLANGKPLIEYPLSSSLQVVDKPIIVIGFQGEKVKAQTADRADFVFQREQLGTGHAVSCAKGLLSDFSGAILVLYGDHPLVSANTMEKLFKLHFESNAVLSLLTTDGGNFSDDHECFYHYGRIIRDQSGKIKSIRELKDCSENEKKIAEVNPGYYCFDSEWLWQNIDSIKNNNNQKEYYLTDMVEIAVKNDEPIASMPIHWQECLGVNTVEQLKAVEKCLEEIERLSDSEIK
ncbi:NTP transferase domain-containing protein [Patescibacteria group bacterium]|nr:NTP transferase domain-containing protein [Patescibacteria group bacterium]